MTRLIDADALSMAMYHEAMEKDSDFQRWDSGCWIRYKLFENVLDAQPTIDAVPVIRCKDCKWYAHCDDCYGDCMKEGAVNGFVYTNDYCSRAEPKDTTEEVRKQLKDMEQRREMDRKK